MPDITNAGRLLVIVGLAIAALGAALWIIGRTGIPIGRLPGDFRFETGALTCFIPLASMILLSLVVTLVVNLVVRFLSK
jgi:hypothetical protein